MNAFRELFLPALKRREGRVDLTVNPVLRLGIMVVGGVLAALLAGTDTRPFAWSAVIVTALAALNEDRWIFDATAGEMRRRSGLLLVARSWAVSLDEVASIELDSDASDLPATDPYARIAGGPGKGSCALRVVMSDGRSMTICAAKVRQLAALRERARAIAEMAGRPMTET